MIHWDLQARFKSGEWRSLQMLYQTEAEAIAAGEYVRLEFPDIEIKAEPVQLPVNFDGDG